MTATTENDNSAVEEFEKFVDTNINTPDLFDYILSLSNARQVGTAAVYAKQARERNGGPIKVITDIEAAYAEGFGRIAEARELTISLTKTGQQTGETQQRLFRINTKLGKPLASLE